MRYLAFDVANLKDKELLRLTCHLEGEYICFYNLNLETRLVCLEKASYLHSLTKSRWLYYHLILAFFTFSQEMKIWDNFRTPNHFVSSKSRKNNILKSKLSSQVVAPSARGLSCLHPTVLRVSPGGLTETDCRARPQICALLVIRRSLEAGCVRGARVRILLQVWTKW